MRKLYRCAIVVEIQMPSLVPGKVDLVGTGQGQRNGSNRPDFRAISDLQSYIVLIVGRVSGFGVTPLARPLIDGLFITITFPARACTFETSGMRFVTFLMSYPLQRLVGA